MKYIISIIILFTLCQYSIVKSQIKTDKKEWLLQYLSDTTATKVKASVDFENGSLHDIAAPREQLSYLVNANGGGFIGRRLNLGGAFSYHYFDRRSQCYSMLTFPNMFPFFCSDSIAGNQIAEHYNVEGYALYELIRDRIAIGCDISFLASSTAKLRDIRNRNIYSQYFVAPVINVFLKKIQLGIGYRYTSIAEDIEYNCYGSNDIIYIDKIEGLWFGNRIVYTSSDVYTRRQFGDENCFNISAKYNSSSMNIRGEYSYFRNDFLFKMRDREERIGETEKNGSRARILFEKVNNKFIHHINSTISIEKQTAYIPIQQKEFSGTAYHFIQYGKVKRYSESNTEFDIDYTLSSDKMTFGTEFSLNTTNRRVYIQPQIYQQNTSRYTVMANGTYIFNKNMQRRLQYIVSMSAGYSTASGTKLKRIHQNVVDVNYYCNTTALTKEFEWLTSKYYIIEPSVTFDFFIKKSNVTVTIKDLSEISQNSSRNTFLLTTSLQLY